MKLPNYVMIAPAHDLPGAGIILHTPTLLLGQVLKFKREMDFLTHLQNTDKIHSRVEGYSIDIIMVGSVKPFRVDISAKDQINHIIGEMADYYLQKIKREPWKYTKFKLR